MLNLSNYRSSSVFFSFFDAVPRIETNLSLSV